MKGLSLEEIIDAKPTATWDEERGDGWIQAETLVTLIYTDLTN